MAQDKKTLEEITSLFTETTKARRLIIDKVSCASLPKVHEDIRRTFILEEGLSKF